MAKEKKTSFQMLPVAHWWNLREKFKQSIPGIVTDNYLATALNTQPRSARANILPYLKDIGLIDQEGKTQDLAKAWRDDKQYADVCKKIRDNLYPDDLIAAVPTPSEDREAIERWFANHTGAGTAAVRRMATIYITISEADVSKKPDKKAKKQGAKPKAKVPQKKQKDNTGGKTAERQSPPPPAPTPLAPSASGAPGLNINLEIHISSDATPDQIDKIFESMAKHIYQK